MCKKIKDILFPLNILGKKHRTFVFEQTHPPYNKYNYYVKWKGERLEFSYTRFYRNGGRTLHMGQREEFTNGDYNEEHLTVRQSTAPTSWAGNLYLKCTNVTYLDVNGTVLIGE